MGDHTVQRRARALGDPTRHRVFATLRDRAEPLGVAELTEAVGVHHNAVRRHLDILEEAGLVRRCRVRPDGPGRPRLAYVVEDSAAGPWGGDDPQEDLACMLAEVIRSGDAPVAVGRRHGAATATRVRDLEELEASLARGGFEPRRAAESSVVLGRCPYERAATISPAVCALHLGVLRGITDGGPVEVLGLHPGDPVHAGCEVRCRVGFGPEPD